jgi:Allene oxide cyclase barrel like domain
MSRKLHTVAALALLLIAAGVMAAGAASDTSSPDDGGGQVIRLTTKQVHQGFVDHGTPGFSVDDQFVFSNDLYRNGEKVGEDGGTCTVTRIASAPTLHCLGTNSLPGGQISVQGLAAPGEPFELAITGGTGRYRGARGQVFGENTSPTEMSIRLVLR